MVKFISIKGAREHNLKNIDVTLPRDQLVVITGLSGSGKSSLAFDTIYAEGQRRYVESLSVYARQFLEQMEKPDVDHIEGLSPSISIEQKTTSRNPRSTVGTVTEIYDYMRLLWARVGVPYSPATQLPIESQTVSQMVDKLLTLPEQTKLYLMAPIVRDRKGEYRKELFELKKKGFQRVKIDGAFYEIESAPALDKKLKHTIEVVVDRIVIKAEIKARLADSLETCLRLADGLAVAELPAQSGPTKEEKRIVFSEKFACPVSGFSIDEIEPRLFSFNNPHGACPTCSGLGEKAYFDPALIVPNHRLSLQDGAIHPWSRSDAAYYQQTLQALARHYGISLTTQWQDLSANNQNIILFGSGEEAIAFVYDDGRRRYEVKKPFEGVVNSIARRWKETESNWMREELERYRSAQPCEACYGVRLRPEALAVKVAGKNIGQITALSVKSALAWFEGVSTSLKKQQQEIAKSILKELVERLQFLNNVGLDYLSLDRKSGTLSGGESQRIRLASQIGSGLTSVLYVLDEPSIGLHQRDNARLITTLKRLRDLGNTVIVVEHDQETIESSDYIVDMGPGAGEHGGQVVAAGPLKNILLSKTSITGQYLSGKRSIPIPSARRIGHRNRALVIKGASANNLKSLDCTIPLGIFTCVTGLSGSGKSTLIIETLFKAVARQLNGASDIPGEHKKIEGLQHLDKVVDIDQSPIGRTPRSNPATYTGVFTPIRDWFAALPEAKARGYKPGRFSFNVKGGRCEACQGDGVIKIEMHFLPDVYVQCAECNGLRYNRETLEVTFKSKSIADILNMTVEEACDFFRTVPVIREKLSMLSRVGLSYIKVGQQAPTLSGGEAQRVKLAKELSRRSTTKTLYILDEPTTGLHFEDVKKLLEVLQALVDSGSTVVVIEHNLDIIKCADHIIDLGPEGGDNGGHIVATGSPEDVARRTSSYTGQFLKKALLKKNSLIKNFKYSKKSQRRLSFS